MEDIFGYKKTFLRKVEHENNVKNLFDNIGEFESTISVSGDLCKFSINELEQLLVNLVVSKGRKPATIKADMSHIYNYLLFCQQLTEVPLNEEIIKKYYKGQGYSSIPNWLKSMGIHTDYSNITLSKDEMMNINNSNEFDAQEKAFFWLLFLGLNEKKIVNIKMEQVNNWQELFKGEIQLNSELTETVNIVLQNAKKQKGIFKDGSNGTPYYVTFKGDKYLFRSYEYENLPVAPGPYYKKIKKLNMLFGKSVKFVNMRKSGMLYFASELIKINTISCKDDFYLKVFQPICERYGEEPKSYYNAFKELIQSNVLEEYYNVSLPKEAYERRLPTTTIKRKFTDTTPSVPQERSETDKKHHRTNEELGLKGEILLLENLKKKYPDKCYQVKDYYGFDIYAKNEDDLRCIEVKTMSDKSCWINITKHEYETATRSSYSKYYWVYIIVMENKPIVFAYKNFFRLLGINDMTEKIFQNNDLNGMGSYGYRDFYIALNEDVFNKSEEHWEL